MTTTGVPQLRTAAERRWRLDRHGVPFGGEEASGFGPRVQGEAAQELYTSLHTITIFPS